MTNPTIHHFPKPANQQLSANLRNFDLQQNIRIRLSDLFGRTILYQEVSNFSTSFQLDISGIEEGFYLLSVESDDPKSSSKVMINRLVLNLP
jgi:hypothetical protein